MLNSFSLGGLDTFGIFYVSAQHLGHAPGLRDAASGPDCSIRPNQIFADIADMAIELNRQSHTIVKEAP
jgi:hypothetical protein